MERNGLLLVKSSSHAAESLVWVGHGAGTSGRKMGEAPVLSLRHKVYWKSQHLISGQFSSIQFGLFSLISCFSQL